MVSKPTEATRRALTGAAAWLPMHDTQDFDDAQRGLMARRKIRQIRAADGRVVLNLDAYDCWPKQAPRPCPTALPHPQPSEYVLSVMCSNARTAPLFSVVGPSPTRIRSAG